jgi:hypothetical protein
MTLHGILQPQARDFKTFRIFVDLVTDLRTRGFQTSLYGWLPPNSALLFHNPGKMMEAAGDLIDAGSIARTCQHL